MATKKSFSKEQWEAMTGTEMSQASRIGTASSVTQQILLCTFELALHEAETTQTLHFGTDRLKTLSQFAVLRRSDETCNIKRRHDT